MFRKSRERLILSTEIAKSYYDSVSSRRSISQWSFLNFDTSYTCVHAYARKYIHALYSLTHVAHPIFLRFSGGWESGMASTLHETASISGKRLSPVPS